jgi:hypothetical protein
MGAATVTFWQQRMIAVTNRPICWYDGVCKQIEVAVVLVGMFCSQELQGACSSTTTTQAFQVDAIMFIHVTVAVSMHRLSSVPDRKHFLKANKLSHSGTFEAPSVSLLKCFCFSVAFWSVDTACKCPAVQSVAWTPPTASAMTCLSNSK